MFFHRPAALTRPGGESAESGGFAVQLSRHHAEESGMSTFDDPFNADRRLSRTGCVCGQHRSADEHDQAALTLRCEPAPNDEARYEGVVASAVMRAMFPRDAARRAFLKSVGASTALAAISQFFPIKTATEVFAEAGAPEKKDLKVGFIPITCATPIIMAAPLGFYAKHGLNVEVVKTAGWAVIRDKTLNKEYDAAHMLAPMPIAISLGLGANAIPFTVPAIENINEHGLDPDTDVQLRSVPPPEMVANLRADNIDGFLAPDNICQRAIYDGVGFLHILSKEIWDGHPCCSFAASREFIIGSPNSFAALTRAIVDATAYASKAENRKQIAEAIAPANYLNAPVTVLEQVLTGTYADGLGDIKTDAKRVDFDPFPWQSFAVWMLTQMKRWGQIKGDVDYKQVAEQVYLATDTRKVMTDMGLAPPETSYKSFAVMGKTFDPAKPEDYLASFKIRKAS